MHAVLWGIRSLEECTWYGMVEREGTCGSDSESEDCVLLSMIIICFIVQYILDSLNNIIFLIACICHMAGN